MSKTIYPDAMPLALNSDGNVPEQIQLVPAGRMPTRDGVFFTNDMPHLVVERFENDPGDKVIDYEHATDLKVADEAPAAGWIKSIFVNDAGEIWGNVEWTPKARSYIANKEYRYISPALLVEKSEGQRVAYLLRASLTNTPRLHMKALNKLPTEPEEPEKPAMKHETRVELCRKLGLADEASDEAILVGLNQLQEQTTLALNSAKNPSADKFVPIEDYQTVSAKLEEVQAELNSTHADKATAAVDAAVKAGKIAPATRDYHLKTCSTKEGLELFNSTYAEAAPLAIAGKPQAKGNPDESAEELTKAELEVCKQLSLDPNDDLVKAEMIKKRSKS
jgi:phage I-like protein